MRKIIFAAALCAVFGAIAGPLGLNKGMTLTALKKKGSFTPDSQQFFYTAKTLTNGHPGFDHYTVILTPENGLCKIIAFGKDFETSAYGTELKERFKGIIIAISGKYGEPGANSDFLRHGSIWDEPRDWMKGLLKKERVLEAFWGSPKNLNMPDSIQSIHVEGSALLKDAGIIMLTYEFDNMDECIKTVNTKRNSSL